MKTFEIRGDWMDGEGFLTGSRSPLLVYVIDGCAYDAVTYDTEPREHREEAARLRVDRDGVIRGWPGARFAPDTGELERVGVKA